MPRAQSSHPAADNVFAPATLSGHVLDGRGEAVAIPPGWAHLPPGDAGLTRRVKAAGPHWMVQEKKGRKVFSHGLWAPAETIGAERLRLEAERQTDAYQNRLEAGRTRRAAEQENYVEDFTAAVEQFLKFSPIYQDKGRRLAALVSAHATPVGSGTVARTKRIPIERRAEAAVIAWMRHQTTAYDSMVIPRVKGARRETRQLLAARSREVLNRYRRGEPLPPDCPLLAALRASAK